MKPSSLEPLAPRPLHFPFCLEEPNMPISAWLSHRLHVDLFSDVISAKAISNHTVSTEFFSSSTVQPSHFSPAGLITPLYYTISLNIVIFFFTNCYLLLESNFLDGWDFVFFTLVFPCSFTYIYIFIYIYVPIYTYICIHIYIIVQVHFVSISPHHSPTPPIPTSHP